MFGFWHIQFTKFRNLNVEPHGTNIQETFKNLNVDLQKNSPTFTDGGIPNPIRV